MQKLKQTYPNYSRWRGRSASCTASKHLGGHQVSQQEHACEGRTRRSGDVGRRHRESGGGTPGHGIGLSVTPKSKFSYYADTI